VKDNGTFELEGLVGGRTFRLMNPPKGWYVKSLMHDGTDITDKGFTFKPGENVDGFDLTLTTKQQTITGSVESAKGEGAKEYTVVVFTEDREKWNLSDNRWLNSARADQQGQFKITGLPPGDYLAIAVDYVEQGEWRDPEWLARAARSATRFTLDEGATKTLTLKLAGG